MNFWSGAHFHIGRAESIFPSPPETIFQFFTALLINPIYFINNVLKPNRNLLISEFESLSMASSAIDSPSTFLGVSFSKPFDYDAARAYTASIQGPVNA